MVRMENSFEEFFYQRVAKESWRGKEVREGWVLCKIGDVG